jgi:transcriptional regulator with GAF, ATPase, and Fis domain
MPSFVYRVPGQQSFKTVPLHKRMTSVGRGAENDISVDDDEMQPHHAIIHFDGEQFQIQAVNRKCEVRIGGKRVKKHALDHHDEIVMGRTLFSFLLYDEPSEETREGMDGAVGALRRLVAFSERLLRRYEIEEVLESLLDEVVAISGADKGMIILADGDELTVRAARNLRKENIQDAVEQLSDSIIEKVVRTREPLIVSDALNDAEWNSSQSVVNLNLCSVMAAPLMSRGSLLGILYVGNDNVVNLFTHEHLEVLVVFAAQASLLLENAVLVNDLRGEKQDLSRQLDEMRFGSIIGASDGMREIYRKVERVAATDVTVLIQGETGTGKELIACEIHNRSDRARKPFITINCGAIPENLLESELFGHVRGAFTGATATKLGRFHLAHGGTVFLDEIGEMSTNLQVKLLRVLQEHVVTKVGDTRPEAVDIRVVAATNKDLDAECRSGGFREDLLYRINVVTLQLPPLRDRGDDVVMIANFLLGRFCESFKVGKKRLSRDCLIAMKKYAWPGNIRQLENRLKKALILSDNAVLEPSDLDLRPEDLQEIASLADAKERFQRDYINDVLARNGGNRTKTARDLGVDPRTIFRHIEKELARDDERS